MQTEVKRDGVTIGRYFYDGEGKRIKKVTDAETTVFVYSGGKLVAEYSTATSSNPTTAYTTTDHLGSPRIITNALGGVVSRRDFLPFGEDIYANIGARTTSLNYGSATDKVRQKFTGYLKDEETGLDFAEARMYQNLHGRFTAVDPLLASGKSANPQTFNRYVYVGNNPVVITDPLGLDWFSRYNNDTERTEYQWFDGKADDGWGAVDFGGFSNTYLKLDDDFCANGECGNGAGYIYKYGGWDYGERARVAEEFAQNALADNAYLAISPQGLALRNENVRNAASDVMGMGAAVLNAGPATYNFGAGIVNVLGGNAPYAPTLEPDENTRSGTRFFFHATDAAMAAQGGVSLFRGARNFFSAGAAKTGLTNPQLVQKSATLAERAIGGTGGVAGTAKHQYANKLLNRYQKIYGDRGLLPNHSFNNGVGNRGFLDVLDSTNGIIYDFKFGKAVMSPAQFNKYTRNFGLPIQIIRP